MKFIVVLSFLIVYSQASPASRWRLLRNPMEDSKYQSILNKVNSFADNEVLRGGRIVGGKYAVLGQFPYQVYGMFDQWLCGGSIISKKFVLTAAHCAYKVSEIQLYAGIISRFDPAPWTSSVGPTEVILHPAYSDETLVNDIALLKTETIPLDELQDILGVVALPSQADVVENLEGIRATVSGFGKYHDELTTPSIFLRFVEVTVISNSRCSEVFGKSFNDSNLCTDGEEGKGSCKGDSGSPLTGEVNGKRVLIGIVSYGAEAGCQKGYPDVFTRVTPYLDWINSHTEIEID